MKHILIVDDEENIRKIIKKYAIYEGYEVSEASNGFDAITLATNNDYDAIILDIMMPEMDGFSACKKIRSVKNTPILMLSARGEEYDKLFGFELGIEDYVVKPFSPKELMARINVLVSRNKYFKKQQNKIIQFEGLKIDFTGRYVYVDNVLIQMTPKEYDLLFYLVKNKNIALSRDKLLNDVWGYDYFGDDRTLDTHIKLLRNSLGSYRKFIVTLRGVGYRFEA